MSTFRPRPLLAALALLVLAACAGDITPDQTATPVDPGPTETLPGPGGPQALFAKTTAGTYTAAIDASGSDWIYLDLDSQTQVFPTSPEASGDWDLAHRGAEIKLNGGSSGAPPTGQPVLAFGDKVAEGSAYPFETVTAAPTTTAVEYQTDGTVNRYPYPLSLLFPDAVDPLYAMNTYPAADQEPDAATQAGDHGWYRDSGLAGGSVISARGNVGYVLRTVECRYYKLRMTGYSDTSGEVAHPQYEFLEIPGNACGNGGSAVAPLGRASFTASGTGYTVAVDATDEEAWVHLDLVNHAQLVPTNPDNDPQGWDIALRRSDLKLNGGVSGSGSVLLHDGLRDDWDARTRAPAVSADSYHTDETDVLAFTTYPAAERSGDAACGGINGDHGWYYYSGFCNDGEGIHHISPRDVVYVLRGRDGQYWKLRLLGYYDSAGSSAHPALEYAPVAAP
ncbi:MAG: HmuY family protein [Stagnimonas sp.]|nr:HmuY family protein [Stagnimonas sp.]